MRLFMTVAGLRCYLDSYRYGHPLTEEAIAREASATGMPLDIGFVPTMGALHAGHISLIQRARRDNKLVVVSIFVNPLQFGPSEDLNRYPRMLEQDKALCEVEGVDVLFAPSPEEMGVVNHNREMTQVVPPPTLISGLCGRSRIGHFQGVATIVLKLFNIVQPTRAYFGQKDAQQLAVLQTLVKDLNVAIEVIGCPIVREIGGLALSSRNQYLKPTEREQALALYRGLSRAKQLFDAGERSSSTLVEAVNAELRVVPTLVPEYVELVDPTTMEMLNEVKDAGLLAVAVRLGSTRLIDNVVLCDRKPIVAIDGPAGAGKSTVAKRVAQNLGLFYLDTGAMYRALTWLVMQSGIAIEDEPAIAELLSQCKIDFRNQEAEDRGQGAENPHSCSTDAQGSPFSISHSSISSVWVNGQDVTQLIRTPEVTSQVSLVAAQPAVRRELVRQQQAYGKQGGIVIEGRDIGTYVFPDAEVKIFLTASVQERAHRRQKDLQNQGIQNVNLKELEQSIAERDRKDSTRVLAPLRKAGDAIELVTDGLTISEVTDRIVQIYHEKLEIPY